MPVPKTPIDKNNRMVLGKDNIRLSGELADIFPLSKTFFEQIFTDFVLRLCKVNDRLAYVCYSIILDVEKQSIWTNFISMIRNNLQTPILDVQLQYAEAK